MIALVIDQPALPRQPAAVAGQFSVGSDHAMTGDEDGDVVHAVGAGHGAHGGWVADRPCFFGITAGLSMGNRSKIVPAATLKIRSDRGNSYLERLSFAAKVLADLSPKLRQMRVLARHDHRVEPAAEGQNRALQALPVGKVKQDNAVVAGDPKHRTQRGADRFR